MTDWYATGGPFYWIFLILCAAAFGNLFWILIKSCGLTRLETAIYAPITIIVCGHLYYHIYQPMVELVFARYTPNYLLGVLGGGALANATFVFITRKQKFNHSKTIMTTTLITVAWIVVFDFVYYVLLN